jgi:hypothetical protein
MELLTLFLQRDTIRFTSSMYLKRPTRSPALPDRRPVELTTDPNVARLSCFAQRKRAPVALILFTASALDKSVTDAYSHLSIQFQGSIDEVKESVRGIYITLICQYMSSNQLIAEHLDTKSGDGYAFPQFANTDNEDIKMRILDELARRIVDDRMHQTDPLQTPLASKDINDNINQVAGLGGVFRSGGGGGGGGGGGCGGCIVVFGIGFETS